MASSGYTAIVFVANEQPTTAKWNLIGSNDSSFNLGTGFEDGVIISRHHAAGGVDAAARSQVIKMGVIAAATFATTGNKIITGVGFRPKLVQFYLLPSNTDAAFQMFDGGMTTTDQFVTAIGRLKSSGNLARYSSTANCIAWITEIVTPTLLASYVSMNDDGFTINVSTATGAFAVGYMATA